MRRFKGPLSMSGLSECDRFLRNRKAEPRFGPAEAGRLVTRYYYLNPERQPRAQILLVDKIVHQCTARTGKTYV